MEGTDPLQMRHAEKLQIPIPMGSAVRLPRIHAARHLTTTDFTAAMAKNRDARALAHGTSRHPIFKSLRE
jgi:hypothetical protein